MQIEAFWKHWQVAEDPFRAEEARDDPVFMRLTDTDTTHPDYEKVFGQPDRPSAAVVFGEKGSGKTALRLLLEKRIRQHNERHPDRKAWVVRYDDLNPVLDRFAHAFKHHLGGEDRLLERFRLADHQDAILSRIVTGLIDALLDESGRSRRAGTRSDETAERDGSDSGPRPGSAGGGGAGEREGIDRSALRRLDRQRRVDLAVLALLYDQPRAGSVRRRWARMRRAIKLGRVPWLRVCRVAGLVLLVLLAGLALAAWWTQEASTAYMLLMAGCAAAAILLLGYWGWRSLRLWWLARRVHREVHVVDRSASELRRMLGDLGAADLASEPLPVPGDHDSRYQLTTRLLDVLEHFGYAGLVVLFDRVDEPAVVHGDPEKMRAVVWPMLNNKFLQQDRVGVKLLLPIELRHLLQREDAAFFQRARLDKQHMVDRLVWSGAALYDLCTRRLRACLADGARPVTLNDLFEEDVSRQDLIDALDQMQQPRDAFKFLYRTIQEHCSNVSQDEPSWRVPRLTLMHVRKQQSQRVQELHRGVTPA